jgi:hypothetical protein
MSEHLPPCYHLVGDPAESFGGPDTRQSPILLKGHDEVGDVASLDRQSQRRDGFPNTAERVLRQNAKVGFAIADRLNVTEGPVRNSGPYSFRSSPVVLALTAH